MKKFSVILEHEGKFTRIIILSLIWSLNIYNLQLFSLPESNEFGAVVDLNLGNHPMVIATFIPTEVERKKSFVSLGHLKTKSNQYQKYEISILLGPSTKQVKIPYGNLKCSSFAGHTNSERGFSLFRLLLQRADVFRVIVVAPVPE